MILGVDEVGRGPWAGPLVVGAVVLPDNFNLPGLTDSKKLSSKQRVILNEAILAQANGWGLGWVDSSELDSIGLSAALRLATIRAVQAIKTPYHEIIIDGTINFLAATSKGKYVTTLAKADLLIPAVSAASIIAKVARDNYMAQQDALYPGYNFSKNVGYGTAEHKRAIESQGITELHRKSFKPIANFLHSSATVNQPAGQITKSPVKHRPGRALNSATGAVLTPNKLTDQPSPTATGRNFEGLVADDLIAKGHTVLHRNWRTRYCEVDIITQKSTSLFFVEVKYRHAFQSGDGLDAITPQKIAQMTKAANIYMAAKPINGRYDNVRLMVAFNDYPTSSTVGLAAKRSSSKIKYVLLD